jgi:hypothetical protein
VSNVGRTSRPTASAVVKSTCSQSWWTVEEQVCQFFPGAVRLLGRAVA